jgi:hypothetical protein
VRSKIALILVIALIGVAAIGFADSKRGNNNDQGQINNQGNANQGGNDQGRGSCDDGNPCTIDRCDLEQGECVYEPVTCVDPKVCSGGLCICPAGRATCYTGCCPEGNVCGVNPENGHETCCPSSQLCGDYCGCLDDYVCISNNCVPQEP